MNSKKFLGAIVITLIFNFVSHAQDIDYNGNTYPDIPTIAKCKIVKINKISGVYVIQATIDHSRIRILSKKRHCSGKNKIKIGNEYLINLVPYNQKSDTICLTVPDFIEIDGKIIPTNDGFSPYFYYGQNLCGLIISETVDLMK